MDTGFDLEWSCSIISRGSPSPGLLVLDRPVLLRLRSAAGAGAAVLQHACAKTGCA